MRLIVDSGSDFTLKEIKQYGLDFLPMNVTINDKTFIDQYEISNQEVYEAIEQGARPMTSQPSIDAMTQLFTEIAANNEQAIYLTLSSSLSGTYQSAVMILNQVKEIYPDVDITIIDSKSASRGLGMQVEALITMRDAHVNKHEMLNNIQELNFSIKHLFTVDDLNYLAKGGRLSKGSAFLGSLIQIKPLLHVEDGSLVPLEKFRGRKKVFTDMVKRINNTTFQIAHSNDLKDAEKLKEMIVQKVPKAEITIHEIGPTISSHTGQGTIALFYFEE